MFSDNFKKYRKLLGMTQDEVAKFLMVTPQAVSKWETGNGTPDISLLVPISELFCISTDELLGRDISLDLLSDEPKSLDGESYRARYERYTDILKTKPFNEYILLKLLSVTAEWVASRKEIPGEQEKEELISCAEDFVKRLQKNSSPVTCISAHSRLADIYTHAGDFKQAKKEIGELPESCRYTQNRMLGNLELKNKEYLSSIEFYRESVYDTLAYLLWDIERIAQCYGAMIYDCGDFKTNRCKMDEIYGIEYELLHSIGTGGSALLKNHLCNAAVRLAQRSVWSGEYEKAFEYLDEFVSVARELQEPSAEENDKCSPILPKRSHDGGAISKSSVIFRLSWNAFNPIRTDVRFQKYLEEINTWK